jgi:hypothetical protein
MKCDLLDAATVPYPTNTTTSFFVTKTTTKKSEIRSSAQNYELRLQMFPPILKLEDYENALTFFKKLNRRAVDTGRFDARWREWVVERGLGVQILAV